MKVNRVPKEILQAVVSMLTPYVEDVTAIGLQNALCAYQGEAQPPRLKPYTRKQAAEALNVSLQTVNRYLNVGVLRRIPYGKRAVRVDAATVREIIDNGVPERYYASSTDAANSEAAEQNSEVVR